jgi:hypothetical protein
MPAVHAVHLAVIARSAEIKHLSASVDNALNLPEIVHS